MKTKPTLMVKAFITTIVAVSQFAYAEENQDITLPTLSVTSSKRISDLEKLDMQTTVIEPQEIKQRNIKVVDELSDQAPGLLFRQRGASIYTNVTLRGQSSLDFYSPKVLIYVDGLPQDPGTFSQSLPVGISRVEVLNGPQGTLYGAGAVGGVIDIVTEKPGEGKNFTLNTSYSNLTKSISGRVNQALIPDNLYIDFSGNYLSEDGEYHDYFSDEEVGESLNKQGKMRLRWAPKGSDWDVMLTARHDNIDSDEEQYVAEADFDSRKAYPVIGTYDLDLDSYGLAASYDAGSFKITSLSSYQDRGLDRTVFSSDMKEQLKHFTQEIRIASKPGAFEQFSYLTGAYYSDSKYDGERASYQQKGSQKTQTYAVFGELTWYLADDWDLTPGARFERTEIENDATLASLSAHDEADYTSISPKISLGYQVSPQTRVYALYSEGTQSGGFTHLSPPQVVSQSYGPENVHNYELGMKGDWLNHRLSVSSAIYYTNIDDYQMYVGAQPLQYLDNVGKVRVKGLTLDSDFKPTKQWLLQLMLAYNDAEFSDYKYSNADYSGNKTPYVPETQASLRTSYKLPLAAKYGQWQLHAQANYNGKIYFSENNDIGQGGYTLWNAGVSWIPQQNITFNLYGNNLGDKDYATYGFSSPSLGSFYQLGKGREVGLNITLSY
jgi:pesticin/yersiniabactin receptor